MRPISQKWMDEEGNVDYDAYIHSHDWDVRRKERLELDNHECQICGTSERPLQVHHRSYANLGNEPMDDLITVCSVCHTIISEIEHTNLSDKICIGLLRLEILKRQYESTYRSMVECAVGDAIVQHIYEMPEVVGSNIPQLEPWISNIIEAIRDNRQHDIQKSGITSFGIAHLIADGTFRKHKTYQQNVAEHMQWTRERVQSLPDIPAWHSYDGTD